MGSVELEEEGCLTEVGEIEIIQGRGHEVALF